MTAAIQEKAMLAGVEISMWSGRKLDREVTTKATQAHAAKADAGRFNKALIGKSALAEIVSIQGQARRELYARTLPWADNGTRILSNAGYDDFAKAMRKLGNDFDAAVDKFVANYADYVEQARGDLGAMFNPDEYPEAHEIRAKFRFKRKIWPMPAAADFRVDVGEAERDRIKAEIAAEFDRAMADAVGDIYQRIADTVGKMADRLGDYGKDLGTDSGRKASFHASLVENVRELVALLPSLNVTGDAKIAEITRRMESLTRFDADDLKRDAGARAETRTAAQEIMSEISEFIA